MAPSNTEVIIAVIALLVLSAVALWASLVFIARVIIGARERCERMFCSREEWLERSHYYD